MNYFSLQFITDNSPLPSSSAAQAASAAAIKTEQLATLDESLTVPNLVGRKVAKLFPQGMLTGQSSAWRFGLGNGDPSKTWLRLVCRDSNCQA